MKATGRKKKPQPPTIDDVAALAGVGRATVSRVLNRKPYVRAEIRDAVTVAVGKLGYKVNRQARALANGSSHNLALIFASSVLAEPNSYYQSGLELGALRASIKAGFQLSTTQVIQENGENSANILKAIESERCDGVILTPPFSDDVGLIQNIVDRGCQAICVSPGVDAPLIVNGVGIDDERAGFDMGKFVGGLHHRHIAYIDAPIEHNAAQLRVKGFLGAIGKTGIDVDGVRRVRGDFTFRSGTDLTYELLARDDRPTIIVCANDDMAVGAMFAAHKMGFDVPRQLSIVGFDDTPISAHIWPPLTTVHQPLREIGQRAVELLVGEIEDPDREARPLRETIGHRIVVRASAGIYRRLHE